MFHACLISTLLCFVYTLRYFYKLSGTNLLTRCHSVSCLFSSVFGSRKEKNQYSRNWTGQKPKSIFCRREHEAGVRDGGDPPGVTPPGRAGGPTPRLGVHPPWWPLPRLFAYKKPPM